MAVASSTPLLGRDAELVRLRELLAAAGAGRAHVAVIAGPAGVGKSRLVAEFADSVDERVLFGACLPLGSQGVRFAPVVAMVRDLVSDPERSAGLPTVFASVLPNADVSSDPMTPLAIYQGVLALLSTGGGEVTVIVIEDIHWADRSTLDLLSMLVTNVRDQRVLLVLTYRTDDVHRDHPLRPVVSELQRYPWVERFDVVPFDAALVAEQIEALTGAPPTNAELAAAMDRTQGNPYFVEQLVAAGGLTDRQLPSSLRDMLLARADVVSADARRTLRIMSLADGPVDDESLARVADRRLSEVRSHLREGLDMLLLAMTSEGVQFAHALVREALESDLLPGERIASHRAFADQLASQLSGGAEQRADLLARLAHHRAAAGDIDEAVDAWRRAAAAAERLGGYAEAVHHLVLIIEHWDTVTAPDRRVATSYESLLARAAECAFLAGDPALACHLATQAVALVDPIDDPGRAGVLHERLARYTNDLGDHARALTLCEQAVELVPASPPSADRACVVAGLARQLMIHNRFADSRTRAIEAAELARATGANVALANALNTLGVVEFDLVDIEAGLVHMQEALRLAGETESADELLRAHWNTFGSLFNAGEFERAAAAFERAREALPEIGQAHLLPELARTAAEVHFRLGDWARAQQIVDEFQRWFPHRADEVELVDMLVARGQFASARATLRRIGDRGAFTDIDQQIFAIDTAAEIELWEGDIDAARLAIDAALELGATGEPRLATASALALGCRIEADAARRQSSVGRVADDSPVAARIQGYLGRIASLLDQPGPERGWKCEARAFAALGRAEATRAAGPPACDAWGSATAAWREVRTPYPAAYTEFRRAEALVECGDRDAATTVMRQAHAVTVDLGAEPLRTLIEAYARRVALDVDAPVDTVAPHGLTPRELEVVAILGHGATNRQIAEAMYISEKTASVHVSNVMRKLGAANRSAVVAIAHREGLVTA